MSAEQMAAELDELERMSFAVLQEKAAERMAAGEFTPIQEVGFAAIRANMKKRKRA